MARGIIAIGLDESDELIERQHDARATTSSSSAPAKAWPSSSRKTDVRADGPSGAGVARDGPRPRTTTWSAWRSSREDDLHPLDLRERLRQAHQDQRVPPADRAGKGVINMKLAPKHRQGARRPGGEGRHRRHPDHARRQDHAHRSGDASARRAARLRASSW